MQAPNTKKSLGMGHTAAEEKMEQIRSRAYELYVERGREDGHDQEDWLQAEAEITGSELKAVA